MPAMTGRQLIEFAGKATSKDLTISSNALPMYFPALQTVAVSGAEISLSSVLVIDNTSSTLSKAVSHSSGAVKASSGTLFSFLASTSGDIEIKDGNTSVARIAVLASSTYDFGPYGIPFTTSISISASAAAGTYVYK